MFILAFLIPNKVITFSKTFLSKNKLIQTVQSEYHVSNNMVFNTLFYILYIKYKHYIIMLRLF